MSEKPLRARKRRDPLSVFLRVIVWLAAIITVGVFVALVGYILIKGVPNLSLDLFQLKYTSDNCSMRWAGFRFHPICAGRARSPTTAATRRSIPVTRGRWRRLRPDYILRRRFSRHCNAKGILSER